MLLLQKQVEIQQKIAQNSFKINVNLSEGFGQQTIKDLTQYMN